MFEILFSIQANFLMFTFLLLSALIRDLTITFVKNTIYHIVADKMFVVLNLAIIIFISINKAKCITDNVPLIITTVTIFTLFIIYDIESSFDKIMLHFFYIISALSILFTKGSTIHLVIYFELMSLFGMILMLNNSAKAKHNTAIIYIIVHILAGSILLCSVITLESNIVITETKEFAKYFLQIAICIASGLTPFTYIITKSYNSINTSTRTLITALSTKMSLFLGLILLAKYNINISVLYKYFGISTIIICSIYAILEKSLSRMILLLNAIHIGFLILAMHINMIPSNIFILMLCVQMLVVFATFTILDRCQAIIRFHSIDASKKDDVDILYILRLYSKKTDIFAMIFGIIIISGIPFTIYYAIESEFIQYADSLTKSLSHYVAFINLFVLGKICFAFFKHNQEKARIGFKYLNEPIKEIIIFITISFIILFSFSARNIFSLYFTETKNIIYQFQNLFIYILKIILFAFIWLIINTTLPLGIKVVFELDVLYNIFEMIKNKIHIPTINIDLSNKLSIIRTEWNMTNKIFTFCNSHNFAILCSVLLLFMLFCITLINLFNT